MKDLVDLLNDGPNSRGAKPPQEGSTTRVNLYAEHWWLGFHVSSHIQPEKFAVKSAHQTEVFPVPLYLVNSNAGSPQALRQRLRQGLGLIRISTSRQGGPEIYEILQLFTPEFLRKIEVSVKAWQFLA